MKWMTLVLVTVAAGHALLVSAPGQHAPRPTRTASAFTAAGFTGVLTAKTGQQIKADFSRSPAIGNHPAGDTSIAGLAARSPARLEESAAPVTRLASHYRQHYTTAIPEDQDQAARPPAGHLRTS